MRIALAALAALLTVVGAQAQERACKDQVGEAKAAELVRECIDISPATHPPCNADNACSLISGEIRRGCDLARQDTTATVPPYCDTYSAASQPGGY
jgi:hypothetical protein